MGFTTITLFSVLLLKLASGVPLASQGARASVELEQFIVGGVKAPEGFAPHMMAIVFVGWVTSLVCGAAIITDRHALTAAHCNDAMRSRDGTMMSSAVGVFGSNRWNSTEYRVRFAYFKNHEGWNPSTIKDDVGLLGLEDKLKFSNTVGPTIRKNIYVGPGVNCHVTGWGRTSAWGPIPDELQLLHVNTISEQACIDGVREASGGWWVPPIEYEKEICTFKAIGQGMCNGDSGSALICRIPSHNPGNGYEEIHAGIVSWGFPCALGAPDMFVRVSHYTDWIESNLH